ncbi:Microtubule-associated protein 70-1 [Bienertia sinuspersici]
MEEKGLSKSCVSVSEARNDSLCAMYFGISCAFFTFKNLSNQAMNDQNSVETRDKMLQGTAHLLGLLVWRKIHEGEEAKSVEKNELLRQLDEAKKEIMELKLTRKEDAKANEKVASIYAAQEQSWFAERRKLRHQVATLLNDLRILDSRKNEAISELSKKVGELEVVVQSKEKVLEEGEMKRKELEEKVKSAEVVLEDLKEINKRENQYHSSEMMKHKTAFIELVSNQRRLEAELSRTLRQVEAAKQQLEFLFDEKEEAMLMVEELSIEMERMRKESEQKDKILSAMMRKIKLDSPEKQMIVKEVKFYKPKKKINERKTTERLGSFPGSRNERHSLRNFLSRQVSSKLLEVFPDDNIRGNVQSEQCDAFFDDLDDAEVKKENEDHYYSPHTEQGFSEGCTGQFHESTRLDEWVHAEAEKYHSSVKQRHQMELDELEEQLRLKDNKLEAYHWQLLSAEVESKRLQSKVEVLNQELAQLRDNNLKLESLSVDRELELKTLQDQIAAMRSSNVSAHKTKKIHSSKRDMLLDDDISGYWSKITKKKPAEKEHQSKKSVVDDAKKEEAKERESLSKHTSSTSFSSVEEVDEKEIVEAKVCLSKTNASPWKVDLHALGVSYKIKRLNQQLLMLDRLTGKQESNEFKNFSMLLSLLKKQVSRYQSLHEKTDNLSKRMGEKGLNLKRGVSKRTKEETRKLEHFLEETFQLQRFIVATGQKLMEVLSKIGSGFVGAIASEFDGVANFDMQRFGDTMQSLFKDVQRGLEVRISRIIGDLEGTLAYEGIHFLK